VGRVNSTLTQDLDDHDLGAVEETAQRNRLADFLLPTLEALYVRSWTAYLHEVKAKERASAVKSFAASYLKESAAENIAMEIDGLDAASPQIQDLIKKEVSAHTKHFKNLAAENKSLKKQLKNFKAGAPSPGGSGSKKPQGSNSDGGNKKPNKNNKKARPGTDAKQSATPAPKGDSRGKLSNKSNGNGRKRNNNKKRN